MTLPFFIKRENYFVRCRSHACQGLGASSVSVPWSFNNTIPYKLASVVEHFTYTFPVILNKCRIELVFNNRDYFIFLLFKWNSHVPPKSDLFTVEHFKFLYVIGKIIKTDRRSFLVNICPFFASRFGKGESMISSSSKNLKENHSHPNSLNFPHCRSNHALPLPSIFIQLSFLSLNSISPFVLILVKE